MPANLRRYSPLKEVYVYPLPRLASDFQQAHAELFQRCVAASPALLPEAVALTAQTASNVFLGPGLALTGFGTAARINTVGADGFQRAGALWQELASSVKVITPAGTSLPTADLPEFPLALGSFGFAPSAHGTLIVPARGLVTTATNESFAFSWDEPWQPEVNEAAATPIRSDWLAPLPQLQRLQAGALTETEWMEAVADVIAKLRAGQARKVVLARDVIAEFSGTVAPLTLLQRLNALYPSCWRFLIDGLIGATPELIARLDANGVVQCRVLAGTAPSGQGMQLENSLKDQREHAIARDSVVERLAPLADQLEYSETPFVLELPNVCHLATDVTAHVPAQVTSLDVAAALHPTAAVCGLPREKAAEIIATHEQLNRGRYAAPLGWVDARGAGEWALALRLGQIDVNDPRRIQLIAGAGIMPDSVPAVELRETQMKLQPLLRALAID